jgi:O-antigen ligase
MVSFKRKLFYLFPVLFCFCFPFGFQILSPILMAWLLVSFFNWDIVSIRKGLFNQNLLLLVSFFLLTVVSSFLSDNHIEAGMAIEIKLSLILFPYLMFGFDWPLNILRRCLVGFVSGCFFACLYLIARASVFAYEGHAEYFSYTFFSDFIHASYFAMYLVLAIGIILNYYRHWFYTNRQIMISSYFFISVFITTIFLCASKMGLISLFFCVPLLLFQKWKGRFGVKRSVLVIALGLALLIGVGRMIPGSFDRFLAVQNISIQHLDKTSSESNTIRLLVWEQSVQLIRDNFWFGLGVGDANDALYKAYADNGITGALEHRLNAHNQYLQTFLGMGFFGFMLLLIITLGQFIKGLKKKNGMLTFFSVLICLNFMVESMLQAVAGTLFFAFFFCLFNLIEEKRMLSE